MPKLRVESDGTPLGEFATSVAALVDRHLDGPDATTPSLLEAHGVLAFEAARVMRKLTEAQAAWEAHLNHAS